MRPVSFVYLREGTSDDGLVPHLRELLVRSGATEAVGTVNTAPGSVEVKLRAALAARTEADLYVVHRDADSRSSEQRRREIVDAAVSTGVAHAHLCVVPVQSLEAWLLLDEAAIRAAVGRPSGRLPLDLPRLRAVEGLHDPKAVLRRALLDASETTGRRRETERRKFSQRRRVLVERLDLDGPLTSVPSWQQLVSDVRSFVERWGAAADGPPRR